MQIALVRHGKPNVDPDDRILPNPVAFVEEYNRAGIDPMLPPPERVRELAAGSTYVLSSNLPRAIESLRILAPGREGPAERIYREAGFPPLPDIIVALNPPLWVTLKILKRLGWLSDDSRIAESLAKARGRARAASRRLVGLAETHGSVLLVGHGMFNTLIASELNAAGWVGPRWPTRGYWSAATYLHSSRAPIGE